MQGTWKNLGSKVELEFYFTANFWQINATTKVLWIIEFVTKGDQGTLFPHKSGKIDNTLT